MDLKTLLIQKRVAKSSLTKLKGKTLEEINTLDISQLNIRRNRFNVIGDDLKNIFDKLFSVCKDEEIDKLCEEKEELFEAIDDVLATIDRIILKFAAKTEEPNSKQFPRAFESNEIKLPTLSLPTFSGKVEEWLAFSDLFQAAVTTNSNLSDAQKLQYLKGSLKGEALKIVQSLTITDANFKIAWDLLSQRYFHKREILSSLMKKFITLPSLSSESHSQILNLVDSSKEFVRMLETLDLKVDNATNTLLMFMIQFKLDPSTRSWWERSLTNDEIPSLDSLLQFLSNHARSLATESQGIKRNICNRKVTLVASGFHSQCAYCQGNHYLSKCDAFLNLSVQKRINFVKSNNICFNCLTQFHRKSSCKSLNKCRKCKKSHHTLLHFENSCDPRSSQLKETNTGLSAFAKVFQPTAVDSINIESGSIQDNRNNSNITSCSGFESDSQILLCTALISVCDSFGGVQFCRALLDPGSQASLITMDCLERLGLPKGRANVRISCLGASDTRTSGISEIQFSPHFTSSVSFTTSVYVVNKIVGQLPHFSLDSSCAEPFYDLKLADPTFFKSGPIDILLGVNVALPLFKGQSLSLGEGKPFAVRSDLGWIIAGSVPSQDVFHSIQVNNIQVISDDIVSRFWKLDSVPSFSAITSEEKACEDHFRNTHVRGKDGRYVVHLPFKMKSKPFGDSKTIAVRRFLNLEKRFLKDPEMHFSYKEFMNEYLSLGHMEKIPSSDTEKPLHETFYLPHHPVIRESSTTTRLRVVFDGSVKSSNGVSLNDNLIVGPRLQQELFFILLRFRTHLVAINADITKMFRQIRVTNEHQDYQRILWRDETSKEISEYRLTTVTYGLASSPYLSTKVLQQLAKDECLNFPLASVVTSRDFYVDDLLSGASTTQEAIELVSQLQGLMKSGGFHLRKWRSNIEAVVKGVSDHQEQNFTQNEDEIKILGIKWNPKGDCFSFGVDLQHEKSTYTKREILSEIARVFDPLGLLSPCVIFMKIFLQELWKLNLEWDQAIPEDLNKKWTNFRKEFPLIQKLMIPRCVLQPLYVQPEIHAFCDASEKAYCTAIYIRCVLSDSDFSASLLTSKTRVAPLKTQSLPRLELCGALLLSELLHAVLKEIQLPIHKTVAWTDSQITLAWLATEPYRWQPFVANRVSKIQTTIPTVEWRHVSSSDNPADLGTRGLLPSQLVNSNQWIYGPSWLSKPIDDTLPCKIQETFSFPDCALKEEKKITSSVIKLLPVPDFITNISSFTRLIRVCAWMLRFLRNSQLPKDRISGCLKSSELHTAVLTIVRLIQHNEFSTERKCLIDKKPLPRDCKLLPLNVFCDSEGILRVGGRLSNHSSLSYDQKHPMLLPKNHEFTRKIINHYHITNLHAGPQLTLSLIRQKFWFVDGRSVVRKELKNCLRCFKTNLKSSPQLMGDLPINRLLQIRPFAITGIDFAGPLLTKCAHKRNATKFKSYICLFICMATKAVHLELVSELSTAAFLSALRRFIARRSSPSKIISDNGSNFKGASRHLKGLVELCHQEDVQNFVSMKGIEWSFIPPYTPHFGGLWESAIKSAKQMFHKTVNSALLNFEELSTLLVQIEACLNSRPLTELSPDPSDFSALTPAHFLVGGPMHQFPEPSQPSKDICLTERWRLIQRLRQYFWNRWSTEYLHRLQPRSKWWRIEPNLRVGDMVIVKKEQSAPLNWTLGRVEKLFHGRDQKVRVVIVNTKYGKLTRSVTKVYLLPEAVNTKEQ